MSSLCTHRSVVGTLALLALTGVASATPLVDPNDPRVFQGATIGTFANLYYGSDTLATRTQVITNGLLDDGIFDTTGFVQSTLLPTAWANASTATGTSLDLTGVGGYAYTTPGPNVFAAANAIDNHWIQSSGTVGDTVFDFGRPVTSAAVFPTIDHGPLPQEAIESTVYLSNDLVNWTQASVLRVFLEGFQTNLGIQWDGFTYVVGTNNGNSFRYASIIHGGPGGLINDGDDEINGVLGFNGIPTPGTASVLALGLLAARRRRRA